MKPVRDEDLILYYYGEAGDRRAVEAELESSPELRQRYMELCQLLDSVEEQPVPERHPAYASRVWHRIAPRIEAVPRPDRRWYWQRLDRRWAGAAALTLLLLAAFLAGRMLPHSPAPEIASQSGDGRERIVLMTVAGHLERSEMLLLELVNAQENGDVDLSVERQLARELSDASRLYRQAASRVGHSDVAVLLGQLETVLVELSQGPRTVTSEDLGELRLRLDEGDVLFRVRVLGSRIRQEALDGETDYHNGAEAREI